MNHASFRGAWVEISLDAIKDNVKKTPIIHCCNSAATIAFP